MGTIAMPTAIGIQSVFAWNRIPDWTPLLKLIANKTTKLAAAKVPRLLVKLATTIAGKTMKANRRSISHKIPAQLPKTGNPWACRIPPSEIIIGMQIKTNKNSSLAPSKLLRS